MSMSNKKFTALLTDYCLQHKLGAPNRILQGAPLILDGAAIVIRYDADAEPAIAYAYCDLGLPAAPDQKPALRKLLSANREIHFASGQALMISPATGHILLAQHIVLHAMTASMLGQILQAMSHTAKHWRDNQFATLLEDAA
jgi:hypothetical protein